MASVFTISLDFELHWGVFDKRDRRSRQVCYQNTLALVPKMLSLFAENNIHVTWAVVGSMFASNEDEWNGLKPTCQPDYSNEGYSPYKWVERYGMLDKHSWAHFAPTIIKTIPTYKGQELGTHTFSHYYCLEEVSNQEAFAADLTAANKAAGQISSKNVSLVFPRNQYNSFALQTCYQQGVKVVRSNPTSAFWSPITNKGAGIKRKILRTGDAYIKLSKERTSYPLTAVKVAQGEPLQLPASRFLRPWQPKQYWLNKMRLKRIINELHDAAKHNECYHLWWHPENFGDHPQQNTDTLKIILAEYKKCTNKYGMQSCNMGEYIPLLHD